MGRLRVRDAALAMGVHPRTLLNRGLRVLPRRPCDPLETTPAAVLAMVGPPRAGRHGMARRPQCALSLEAVLRPAWAREETIRLYREAGSIAKMARLVGCTPRTVCRLANKLGLRLGAQLLLDKQRPWDSRMIPGTYQG